MKVILLERVGRTGHIGDEVTVKDGFARNFLLPQHKALRATEANRKRFEVERARHREAQRTSAAKPLPASPTGLNGKTVVIIRQAGETGQLYGSVVVARRRRGPVGRRLHRRPLAGRPRRPDQDRRRPRRCRCTCTPKSP